MVPFDFEPRTRVVFGRGTVERAGQLAHALHFARVLLVAGRGVLKAGHVETVTTALESERITVVPYHDFAENPDSAMVDAGPALPNRCTLTRSSRLAAAAPW